MLIYFNAFESKVGVLIFKCIVRMRINRNDFLTSCFWNVSMFAVASSWNKNSLPIRRGVSPLFFSLLPIIANLTPALFKIFANDCTWGKLETYFTDLQLLSTLLLRSVILQINHQQYRNQLPQK